MAMFFTTLAWIGWFGLLAAGLLLMLLFMAFADSPDAAAATKKAITPALIWCGLAIWLSFTLMQSRSGIAWTLLAYLLSLSPPAVMLGLLTLFSRKR